MSDPRKIIRNPAYAEPRRARLFGPVGEEPAPEPHAPTPASFPDARTPPTCVPSAHSIEDRVSVELRPADPHAKRIPASYRPPVVAVPAMPDARAKPRESPAAALAAGRSAAPADELTDHEYDGIREYDNPTPGWWHAIFVGSIIFSVFYALVYHFSPLVPSLAERHDRAEAIALSRMFAELTGMPMGEEKIRTIQGQEKWLTMGAGIFAGQCALCHGQQGEGLVGPNLTDDVYKNAASLTDLAAVIADGAGNGAMPAQKTILNPDEIALVTAYVASLRGKNLPGPRGPEGAQIPPFPAPIVGD